MDKNSISGSFANVLRHLFIFISRLTKEFPSFVLATLLSFSCVIMLLINSQQLTIIVLCFVVTFVSLMIYFKTDKFAEISLTFILGIFAIFSITWDSQKAIIFGVFYIIFMWFVFIINSIKSGSRHNLILTQASSSYHNEEQNETLSRLKKISMLSDIGILSPCERAESIRYFAFRKMEIDTIAPLLKLVETVSIISSLPILKVSDFVYSLYVITDSETFETLELYIDQIVILPCSLAEFINIFEKTKIFLLQERVEFPYYLETISKLIKEGFSSDNIYDHFDSKYLKARNNQS